MSGETVGNEKELPQCDIANPGDLEAWYGNFGYDQHLRKILLANCRETERARALAREQKLSEARIDDLARVSDPYIDFIIRNLKGRIARDNMVRETMRSGA